MSACAARIFREGWEQGDRAFVPVMMLSLLEVFTVLDASLLSVCVLRV